MGAVPFMCHGHHRWLATVDALRAELTKLKVELVGLRAGAYNRGKVDAFEEAARAIEPDVWLIYTGPGGFDPEHLQKQGAERIRFLADRERDFDLAEKALKNPRRIPHNELRKELGLGQEDPSSASPPTPPPSALRRVCGMLKFTILGNCMYWMVAPILWISPGNSLDTKINMTKLFLLAWPLILAAALMADIRIWRFEHRLWLKQEAPPFWRTLMYGRPQLEPE